MNQVFLVGTIIDIPIKKADTAMVTLAIPRNYKNLDGEYETDFVDIIIKGSVANTTTEYCKKGDIIGAKGMIQSEDSVEKDIRVMRIMANKITFLSSKKDWLNDMSIYKKGYCKDFILFR